MAHLMTDKSNAITSRLIALDRAECLERLGYGSYVGRIGFIHDGRPMVLPVNYLLEGETIIFRTWSVHWMARRWRSRSTATYLLSILAGVCSRMDASNAFRMTPTWNGYAGVRSAHGRGTPPTNSC